MKNDKKNEEKCLENEILAPYTHISKHVEKLLITKIFGSFNHWFKVPDDVVDRVIETLTTMVNGLFLIDDVQDNSLIRRGVPTAQCVYGVPLTINSAVQVIAKAMQKICDLVPSGLGGKLFADNLNELCIGQGTEIYWRDNFICPTEESYKKMHQQKTGAFIKLGVKILQILSDNKEDYDCIVQLLGYYSQLRDDYCNLCAKDLNQDSSFCEDLTEGKFTLPIIHASKTSAGHEVLSILLVSYYIENYERLINQHSLIYLLMYSQRIYIYKKMISLASKAILRQRSSDLNLKKYCLTLLEQAGSLQYTRNRLSELDCEARAEVSRLGGNPLLETVLDELNSWRDDKMFVTL